MQTNMYKNIEKIRTAFGNIGKLPKALIKYGCYVFFVLLTIGSVLVLLNNTVLPHNSYLDLVSKSIVTTSFTIAAEAIIGGLVIDFVFSKK